MWVIVLIVQVAQEYSRVVDWCKVHLGWGRGRLQTYYVGDPRPEFYVLLAFSICTGSIEWNFSLISSLPYEVWSKSDESLYWKKMSN